MSIYYQINLKQQNLFTLYSHAEYVVRLMNVNTMQNLQSNSEKDINDVFDDILFSEDRLIEESYQKGYGIGQEDGNIEAYHLGYHRGAELGAEIGYYTSVTDSYLKQFESDNSASEKVIKALTTLKNLLSTFPHENDIEIDIIQLCSNIRAQFKKVCALLKIESSPFEQTAQLSF